MPSKQVNNVPVEHVGGPQTQGPWPNEVSEIATGEAYQRPVTIEDGMVDDVQVTVDEIRQVTRPDGTETDGYVVVQQFTPP
jgi:hypothetical protein